MAREEKEQIAAEFEDKSASFNKEIEELQIMVDPVKNARAAAHTQGPSAMDSDTITTLRKETEQLRSDLRDARASTSAASSTVPAAEVARLQQELGEFERRNKELKDQLRDAHARAAKLEALTCVGPGDEER